MSKIKSWFSKAPVLFTVGAMAVGGILTLAFSGIRKVLTPIAEKVPGKS